MHTLIHKPMYRCLLTLFITASLVAGSLYAFGDQIFSNFPRMVG